MAGSWSGSIDSSFAGGGTVTLDITESFTRDTLGLLATAEGMYPSSISGTWIANYNGDVNDNGGTFSGTNTDGVISGVLTSSLNNGCSADFEGMKTGNELSGTFDAFDCDVEDRGDFALTFRPESQIRDINGSYSGAINTNLAGQGTVTLTVTQTGLNFTGRMTANFAGTTFDTSGDIGGTINGSSIQLKFFPDSPSDCPFSATGTVGGSNSISGSFDAFSCSENVFGNFSVTQ
ncbi:MAG: hypothetical protein COA73_12960 [Candidatus Hydrogenedentota bacterium]|nr:MAG: hypothetical protein COA73_12960 [Candidatus Hydrogenedentota bacterium]